ncbi:DNA-processing protein DprA [Psychromarinibacter sp. C21-152]|uniref:DNA-processing protein DprA n=1 Tax=Psychromarinibacter sediminicola TaxID=3033385 RepID=A0AAE3NWU7_9RHOB|nr:DNA-processing protein DprA [Psychromarinibacter sediminicola]MDF0602415.1 DNA-processing protein DprA [Psychromarinibacter sediminicola]
MAKDLLPSPHPLTPPRSEDDWVAWFRLLRSRRVGATTFHRLMGEHGSADAALEALPEVARAAGVADYAPCPPEIALNEMKQGQLFGARPLAFGAPDYPARLAQLPDAPPILWVLGETALLSRPVAALVGARNASSLGTRMARQLAHGLTEAGFAVVSGLARGVDTAAHLAALDGGTIAVLAGGVDVVYPAENAVLAQEIAEKGLRLSEQPMGMQPQARHFPSRNRIISGLARAVVVVEAAAKSGSLITARNALDQGREVMAVPGHPFDARGAGCNMLIRDGATLVRSAADVIEAIGAEAEEPTLPLGPAADAPPAAKKSSEPVAAERRSADQAPERSGAAPTPAATSAASAVAAGNPDPPRRSLKETAKLHSRILDRLGPSPLAEDQLIRDLGLPAGRVAPELVTLELEGKIERKAGGLLSKP